MAYQIVKMETRTTRMITWLAGVQKAVTDFLPGGKTRSKVETIAVEMENQDTEWYRSVKKAIAVAVYNAFSFGLRQPLKATTSVTLTASPDPSSDIPIPIGSQVSVPASDNQAEKIYVTTAAAVMSAGTSTVSVPVACTVAGSIGNTGAGTITTLKTSIPGITAVTNPAAVVNGTDIETEPERQTRFQKYILNLKRGVLGAIEYAAGNAVVLDGGGTPVEYVRSAVAIEPFETDVTKPVGVFECYIYGTGGNPSDALVAQARKLIYGYTTDAGEKVPGYKAAGTTCNVIKATGVALDVALTITLLPGAVAGTVESTVRDRVSNYIIGLDIGKPFVEAAVTAIIMGVAGVYDVAISSPVGNQTPGPTEVYTVGTITVGWA